MGDSLKGSQADNSPRGSITSDKTGSSGFDLNALAKAAQQESAAGERPVDTWSPPYCGEMDMVIRTDGTWWHEGGMITRLPLVKLFASILRKDADGRTYLVTPVEKIGIQVERAPFIATQVDIVGAGKDQVMTFQTNVGDYVVMGPDRPLHVETDTLTLEPAPYIRVRGRLDAILSRPVFYELVDKAVEIETDEGRQLGVYSQGTFFPLGPIDAHLI